MFFWAKAAVGAVALGSLAVGGWGISVFVKSIAPEVKSLKDVNNTSLDDNKVGGIEANRALLAAATESKNKA